MIERMNAVRKRVPFLYWIAYDVVIGPLLVWGMIDLSGWFVLGLVMFLFAAFFDVTESIVKLHRRH